MNFRSPLRHAVMQNGHGPDSLDMRLSISGTKDYALQGTGAPATAPARADGSLAVNAMQAAAGDRAAFARIYDELADDLFAFIAFRTGGEAGIAEAEDLVAEVFLKAWRYARSFDAKKGSYRAWIFTIARNELNDALQRVRTTMADVHLSELEEGSFEPQGVDDIPGHPAFDSTDLRSAMKCLPDDERQAVMLHFFGSCTYREIGRILDIREGAARRLVFRAVTHLRRGLDDAT